ncbi:MAG: MFS transporter, partial [Oscillospiraceae bacterium]|nr:MFS transporter [Oscillospiraceae bacterium]
VGDLYFGVRNAGAFAGAANFVIQLGQALSVGLVLAGIGLAGFVEQDISYGAQQVVAQSASAQTAILVIMALTPLIFMSIGIFFSTRYKLNKENHAKVLSALEGDNNEKSAVLKLL